MLEAGTKTLKRGRLEMQGIGFMVSIREDETLESEFGRLVGALYDWYDQYGICCAELTLAFVAPEEDHEQIMNYCLSLVQTEEPLHALFLQLEEVAVYLATPMGKEPREFKILVDEVE